ncbi:hypothetical protein [uncultured Polaribacter sp.]|uniref:hypothetical protein n=1 Tax=uncultured Polaribacter sp. TaxID=174711 RepID=UPI00260BAED9|nr:hypothetical protein [uncultured Polaribacter sp.]
MQEELQEELSEINEKVTETNSIIEKDKGKESISSINELKEKDENLIQMEEVMTKGMEFLTGIYAMSSGKQVENTAKPKVNVNKQTGEVSIIFKMDF